MLLPLSAGAQQLTTRQQVEMAACALRGGEGWIEKDWYKSGKISFNYISEPDPDEMGEKDPDKKSPRQIYAAFWNPPHNLGALLVFSFWRTSHAKDFFFLHNQGHIVTIQGRMDVRDALWGMATHRKLLSMLARLKRKPATVIGVAHARAGSSICKTLVDIDEGTN